MIFSPLHLRLIGARLGLPLSRDSESALIERFGSAEQKSNLELYKADLCASNPEQWCKHVSNYLETFGLSRLNLRDGEGSAFARLYSPARRKVADERKVSVLMAAYNSAETIGWAVRSVLQQSWHNLEVFVVDDASTNSTWSQISAIAQQDSRLTVVRNSINVGPFVSRNRVLSLATGEFITGHDADDWAHPQRIERQIGLIDANPGAVGIPNMMLRVNQTLRLRHLATDRKRLVDRPYSLHPVSSLIRADAFIQQLGHWDSVRFSGDGELLKRAQRIFGRRFLTSTLVGNLALDRPDSIMGHAVHGRAKGKRALSPTRVAYRRSYSHWHRSIDLKNGYMPFPLSERKFEAPLVMQVELAAVQKLLGDA